MAAQKEETEGKKRRKRFVQNRPGRKLLLNDEVEVRSLEEGFLGSWHVGVVTGCGEESRRIKYRDILSDNGSRNLVEFVRVSPLLERSVLENQGTHMNYRGIIRPTPPLINFLKWSLHYGLCVDVFVQDAWWEGVVFDHEDGSDERKVFFPDMGDEINAQTKTMRITQDWDEVTGEWKPRGTWLFLQLIEEVELEWPLLVSIRQIWYEVRLKRGFQHLKEWTSTPRDIWKELLLQVLCNNFKLTMNQIFCELISAGDLRPEDRPFSEFSEPALDVVLKPETFVGDSLAIVPYETDCQLSNHAVPLGDLNNIGFFPVEEQICPDVLASMEQYCWPERTDATILVPSFKEASCVLPPTLAILPPNQDNVSTIGSDNNIIECPTASSKKSIGKVKTVTARTRLPWRPAEPDMVPEGEYCPGAITGYMNACGSNNKQRNIVKSHARKHLLYLGWKIEFARDGKITRMRYTSPKGQTFFSLLKVCEELEPRSVVLCPTSQDNSDGNNVGSDDNLISFPAEIPKACRGKSKLLSNSEFNIIEPDYNPQAVVEYLLFVRQDFHPKKNGVSSMALKAKKHLSSSGWTLYVHPKKEKKEMRYRSPCGKLFYSLVTACEWCVTKEGLAPSNGYTSDHMQNKHVSAKTMLQLAVKESSPPSIDLELHGNLMLHDDLSRKLFTESSSSALVPKEPLERGEDKVHGTKRPKRKRKHGVKSSSALLQTDPQNVLCPFEGESQSSIKKRHNIDSECSAPMLRSSKRARQIVGSSSTHQTPRTILSWLIDGNVVLPRAKVQYCGRKDGRPMKEGRVTREGIKCLCCQKIFTLSKFEAHAGSTYHRPSANIFLEDGRSLLECQLQLKRVNSTRKTRSEAREIKGSRHSNTNDYICSVCHYGGELVLCDQCPSSFHTTCVGLKEVPDGDWFCPSCCCGICLLGRFNISTEQLLDDRVLNCGQCEHQYHVGCLRNKGILNLDTYPEGNWFCNKGCEQIYSGLQKLLGKPIAVGLDNLTWTLLKYTKGEDSGQDGDDEHLMETYSRLNVALSVMHECFEPVKEPRTRRDLVEDVIFSRWSELNRLNFQGFYTVLLERDDELITVATVRVYGEKVAEIPLIGTRFQYRRLGMCRILMNELEKKLMELGVERLVLPAVPSVLNTWTTSFGFSMMNESERLKFLNYTFLDFQGTFMCQKLLKKIRPSESILSKEIPPELCDYISKNDVVDLEGNSAVSEVFQADQTEASEIVDQGFAEGIGTRSDKFPSPPSVTANEFTTTCQNEIAPGYSVEGIHQKESEKDNNGVFKCYKRRRISTCVT